MSERTRRSTADVSDAVCEAVREELAELGYQGLTMVGVARRAGTSRRALYLRWSNKDQMIYDSIAPFVPTAVSFTSSGDLRTDLIEYLPRVSQFEGTLGRAARSVVAESYRDPDSLAELRERLMTASLSGLRQLLLEAIARGEANPSALDPEILMVISAVSFHQLCLGSEPISEETAARFVDRVLLSIVQSETYARDGVSEAI
ncbi:TetR/AcrR family transcriptional regulator [Streptantibioticus silvisoli]|uniref:TetR/AcrR family transcriptional regulator n=1 Tax=Streptantibioticus silvisoli TaxID=2705255 RepID=A0ABT6VZN1_9ACTN|nr:TetR/AcrR family transcriptional regulator [Streptantibioticus silvisoli]MDI5963946.1 TetR/AcrR family transcriptional regulator [Streptantibioticus silvisoli]